MSANGYLSHEPASGACEHDHALAIFCIQRRALGGCHRVHLGTHFKMGLLELGEGLGSLKKKDFVKDLSTDLGPDIYLRERCFSDGLAFL